MDTKDILFICGGAFNDLERIVADRTNRASMGFNNPVRYALSVILGDPGYTASICRYPMHSLLQYRHSDDAFRLRQNVFAGKICQQYNWPSSKIDHANMGRS